MSLAFTMASSLRLTNILLGLPPRMFQPNVVASFACEIQVSRLGDARIGRRGIEHFRLCPNPQANPLPQGQFDERDKQSSRTAAQVDPVPRCQPTRCLQAGRRGTIADAESTRAVSMHDAKGAEPMSTLKLFAACHPREPRRNACVGAGGGLRTRLLRTILSYCELQQRRSG